jgi:uncharacterized protein
VTIRGVIAWLVMVQALALTALVAADGSPGWRLARITVVVAAAIAVWMGARRGGLRVCGWTVLGWGVVGLVTGLGIAPAHLTKAGLTPFAVAGTVALATGLALTVYATAVLVRGARGWRKLLAVPVGALVAQFVLFPLPQSVAATNVPPTAVGRTPATVGLGYTDVLVRTGDGVTLAAWFVPSRNRAVVILLHGAGSTRSAVLEHAVVLGRHGYGVFLLDTRGHGASGGRAMDFGWYGVPDVRAAVDHLTRRSDVDARRIGVVGLSMGAEQALTAAAGDGRIKAVVAEGVERRSTADLVALPTDPRGGVQRAVEWTVFAAADLMTSAKQPIGLADAVAATAPRPILLVAGRGEIEGARHYRAAAPAATDLWELPDTPHTQALKRHPEEWATRVNAFLDRALLT